MVINDTVGKQGIVQDIYFEVNADSISYPIEDVIRNANTSLDVAVALILGADSRWQFDSTNSTDLPIGSTNIISGQQDYSFDQQYLVIKSLEIADSTGKWRKLEPVDNYDGDEDLNRLGFSDFETTPGVPKYYDKMGESILLYPTPNYNRRLVEENQAGLRAYFQRKIDYFSVSDTTKEPGYAKHLHKFTSLYCQHAYAKAKNLPKINQIEKDLVFYTGNEHLGGRDKGEIKRFYAYREQDFKRRLRVRQENTR